MNVLRSVAGPTAYASTLIQFNVYFFDYLDPTLTANSSHKMFSSRHAR